MNNPNPNPNPLPIYVDQNAIENGPRAVLPPGEGEAAQWGDVCNGKGGSRFVWVMCLPGRSPSRWTYAENLRPWAVYVVTRRGGLGGKVTSSGTLAGALKLAKRLAAEGGR